MFDGSHLLSHPVLGFYLLGGFYYLFILLTSHQSVHIFSSLWDSALESFIFLGIYPIFSKLSNLLAYNCSQYLLNIFCNSLISVIISPVLFIIFYIQVLSVFLMILTKGLSTFFLFKKKQLLVYLSFLLFLCSYFFFLCSSLFLFFY